MQKHLGKLINISIVLMTCSITMANDQFDPPKLLKMGKLLNSDPENRRFWKELIL